MIRRNSYLLLCKNQMLRAWQADLIKITAKIAFRIPDKLAYRVMTDSIRTNQLAPQPDAGQQESIQQPAWHVVILSIFTFGAYNMYWLWRSLRTLRDRSEALKIQLEQSKNDPTQTEPDLRLLGRLEKAGTLQAYFAFAEARPVLTTALFAIPVVNLLVLLGFANAVAGLWPDGKSIVRKKSKLIAFLVALLFGSLTLLFLLKEPYQLLYLSSSMALFIVQVWLNRHWKLVEGDGKGEEKLARQAFSPVELVAIIFGAAWIGLIAIHPDLKFYK